MQQYVDRRLKTLNQCRLRRQFFRRLRFWFGATFLVRFRKDEKFRGFCLAATVCGALRHLGVPWQRRAKRTASCQADSISAIFIVRSVAMHVANGVQNVNNDEQSFVSDGCPHSEKN